MFRAGGMRHCPSLRRHSAIWEDQDNNDDDNNSNNNNNNNNNVTYKAQIYTDSLCTVSCVSVKPKCFQSLPEGTQ